VVVVMVVIVWNVRNGSQGVQVPEDGTIVLSAAVDAQKSGILKLESERGSSLHCIFISIGIGIGIIYLRQ
jgi:hypothetical protein